MVPRMTVITVCTAALLAMTGCSSGFGQQQDEPQEKGAGQTLRVLIASSGDAETTAVKKATAKWAMESGNKVSVQVAKDLDQQLGQAFAGGEPPDVFYVNSDQFANYAEGGSLYAYGDQISDVDDISSGLRESFTHGGKLTCVPKDFSTLALAINTDLWKKAGLGEPDYPKTWADLERVAARLTSGKTTGLVVSAEYQRLGVFMKQAGGGVTDDRQRTMTADSPENAEALSFVQKLLKAGSMQYAKHVDTSWGGEALGKGRAAMTIEGNWLVGAMKLDYPDVRYEVLPLPAGPAGKGTLAFSNCWGVAQNSSHHEAAVDLIDHLSGDTEQLALADAIGVMPSRDSALETYRTSYPQSAAWVEGSDYAQGPMTVPGFVKVIEQFNTELDSLKTADPEKLLSSLQRNGEHAMQKGS